MGLMKFWKNAIQRPITVSEDNPLPIKDMGISGDGGSQDVKITNEESNPVPVKRVGEGQVIKSETITDVGQTVTEYSTPDATAYRLKAPSGNSANLIIFLNADDETPGDEHNVSIGDPNLVPENIKSGVTIFGVEGTYTGETDGGN